MGSLVSTLTVVVLTVAVLVAGAFLLLGLEVNVNPPTTVRKFLGLSVSTREEADEAREKDMVDKWCTADRLSKYGKVSPKPAKPEKPSTQTSPPPK